MDPRSPRKYMAEELLHDLAPYLDKSRRLTKKVHELPPGLVTRIKKFSAQNSGCYSTHHAFYLLKVHPQRQHLNDDVANRALREIVPRELAMEIYERRVTVRLGDLFSNCNGYGALYHRFLNREGSCKKALDELYPDLRERYGCGLYDAIFHRRSDQKICERLEDLFFAGKDLSPVTLKQTGERALASQIIAAGTPPLGKMLQSDRRVTKTNGQEALKKKRAPRKSHTSLYAAGVCTYLKHLPVKPSDFLAEDHGAIKLVATLSEYEMYFLLAIAQTYDPALRKLRGLRDIIPAPLTHVVGPPARDALQVENGDSNSYADVRVSSGTSRADHLVEVKNYQNFNCKMAQFEKSGIVKYRKVWSWADGASVGERILLLNSTGRNVQDAKQLCLDKAWRVLDAQQFAELYEQAIDLLLENNPDFFTNAPVPLYDAKRKLIEMNDDLASRQYIMSRRPHRLKREWLTALFSQNIPALKDSNLPCRNEPPNVVITPFSAMRDWYGSKVGRGCKQELFVDIETAGFMNTGKPVFVLGMAYSKCGELVAEQHVARDPLEERDVLLRLQALRKEYPREVTFNGTSFDLRFIDERCLANLIRPTNGREHIDLLPSAYKAAKYQQMSSAALQEHERVHFPKAYALRRTRDIAGSEIPSIYNDLIFGKEHALTSVLFHNLYDLVSMAELYKKQRPKI